MKKLALVLVAALALVACEPPTAPTYSGPADGRKVAVVGDSITASAVKPIRESLSEYQLAVTATAGIALAAGRIQLVQPAVMTRPEVLVIELGINSATVAWDSDDLPNLEGILADVKTIPCVIWVTPTALAPSSFDPGGKGTLQSRLESFKASLKKRLPAHRNVHLADWGPTELANPAWFTSDHLHLSPAGQAAYGRYLDERVAALCG